MGGSSPVHGHCAHDSKTFFVATRVSTCLFCCCTARHFLHVATKLACTMVRSSIRSCRVKHLNHHHYLTVHVCWTTFFHRRYHIFRSLGLRHLIVVNDTYDVAGMITRTRVAPHSVEEVHEEFEEQVVFLLPQNFVLKACCWLGWSTNSRCSFVCCLLTSFMPVPI